MSQFSFVDRMHSTTDIRIQNYFLLRNYYYYYYYYVELKAAFFSICSGVETNYKIYSVEKVKSSFEYTTI